MDGMTELAISGPLLFAAALSLLAGLVSFASPCIVPLVPGYLAYMSAMVGADAPRVSGEEQGPQRGRHRVVLAAGLFVLGFTAVFAAGIGSIVWLADALLINQGLLERIGGVLTIAMALVFLGLVPMMQREVRVHAVPRAGMLGAPMLGGVFALSWTPCIGPTLAGVLAIASSTGDTAARGFLLVVIYCLGLGLPFVLIALGTRWAMRATDWLRANSRKVQIFGGVLLLGVGILLASGAWGWLVAWMRDAFITDVVLPI
ncbi:cytochrome c biogenesis CcdA family protein [Haloechinothrix sp. LS1_15]|uniref:cytochrome c biogenesis CcdA family protein n=1 Tax=Haloechinothrix sp. LS1_15 TaxID=2652248 RepID=UPI0029488B20|nr:cytochrome c biogenesis CcdA family protein [Haloechinothrix sp. LS1_15]MDV6012641.1 cytochrome c biogenesis protein CcdA [Haloechinothrix sp. LS1_15]